MSNARHIATAKHVRLFDTAAEAWQHAQSRITDKHEWTDFHVAVNAAGQFYLVCIVNRAVAYRWLCEQGFHVHVER